MFAEQFVIPVDQFGLPDSGIQLAGGDGVYLAASRSDRTGRDEDDLHTFAVQLGHLIH